MWPTSTTSMTSSCAQQLQWQINPLSQENHSEGPNYRAMTLTRSWTSSVPATLSRKSSIQMEYRISPANKVVSLLTVAHPDSNSGPLTVKGILLELTPLQLSNSPILILWRYLSTYHILQPAFLTVAFTFPICISPSRDSCAVVRLATSAGLSWAPFSGRFNWMILCGFWSFQTLKAFWKWPYQSSPFQQGL